MPNMVKMKFQVGDKHVERDVPDFDWEAFRGNMLNAEAYARKCYFAAVQRISREIYEGKNQTSETHLASMEAVLGRSLFYTQQEIENWFELQKWERCQFQRDMASALPILKDAILKLAAAKESPYSGKDRAILEKHIVDVLDDSHDEIAVYLFSKLDVQPKPVELADLG
jgi:hypothetical protein